MAPAIRRAIHCRFLALIVVLVETFRAPWLLLVDVRTHVHFWLAAYIAVLPVHGIAFHLVLRRAGHVSLGLGLLEVLGISR